MIKKLDLVVIKEGDDQMKMLEEFALLQKKEGEEEEANQMHN